MVCFEFSCFPIELISTMIATPQNLLIYLAEIVIYPLQERVDVQTGIRLILNLCLADGFDMFPTLLVTDGSCMIDRQMGIHGHPLEIQALFYLALRSSREMLIVNENTKYLVAAVNNRLSALSATSSATITDDVPVIDATNPVAQPPSQNSAGNRASPPLPNSRPVVQDRPAYEDIRTFNPAKNHVVPAKNHAAPATNNAAPTDKAATEIEQPITAPDFPIATQSAVTTENNPAAIAISPTAQNNSSHTYTTKSGRHINKPTHLKDYILPLPFRINILITRAAKKGKKRNPNEFAGGSTYNKRVTRPRSELSSLAE
ncbi:hypothetical protein G4B88_011078 [Cannabis sativa]|uniref:Alkaline/neutral invertase n=1 Tax=Cannabis sativa TaxID=3483 RepID=A0A7J6FAN7_CANSA|nr:hypothetical protein G4B88_011078 [Cannabis sativa]